MDLNSFKKAAHNLDKILAILGLPIALTTALASFTVDNPHYLVVSIILLLACITYLSIGRGKELPGISEPPRTHSLHLLLNILFFSALIFSILSLYLRPDPYIRPLSYFISIVMMVGILTTEILFLSRSKPYTHFVLTKIILIPLSLTWSQLLIFPTLIGEDPFWHQWFTQAILDSGFLSGGGGYTSLPVMHLVGGATSLITGLGYKMAAMLSISSVNIIGLLLFTFLLSRFIFNAKVGLLAALLLGVSVDLIGMSHLIMPNTFAAFMIPTIIYLLFKLRPTNPLVGTSLCLLFIATLILTHTVVSMFMATLLFALWAGSKVFNSAYNKRITVVTLNIAILFFVAMLGWWMYASGHIIVLAQIIGWGFSLDYWYQYAPVYKEIAQYTYRVPSYESLFNSIGRYFLLGVSLPGCFYMLSKKVNHPYAFALAVGVISIISVVFLASVFHFEIQTGRWHYLLQIISPVPLAVTILLFSTRIKNEVGRILSVATLTATLAFLMIMSPIANMDNPLFKNTVIRKASLESELQAKETIAELAGQAIGANGGPQFAPPKSFYTKDFTEYRDSIIMIRREISQGTISRGVNSYIKLNYDPVQFLTEEGFSRIYESNSVSAFYWNSKQPPSQGGP